MQRSTVFGLACEQARNEGYDVELVIVSDDCALLERDEDRIVGPPPEEAGYSYRNSKCVAVHHARCSYAAQLTRATYVTCAATRLEQLDQDGLTHVGVLIEPGGVLVNKQVPTNTDDTLVNPDLPDEGFVDSPLRYKSPIGGYVDQVLLTTSTNQQKLIKVRALRRGARHWVPDRTAPAVQHPQSLCLRVVARCLAADPDAASAPARAR